MGILARTRPFVCVLVIVGALVALSFGVAAAAQQPPTDPALRLPYMADLASRYGLGWEQHVDPAVRPMILFQRAVGSHAYVFGWADEQPNPTYTHPRVIIDVANWDHSDLFALGLPRVYDNKPVAIHESVVPKAAGICDFSRPAYGGMPIGNDRLNDGGTLGGEVIGQGWPTNAGWHYIVSDQHVLADTSGGQAGDVISQPPYGFGCAQSQTIGSLVLIPSSLIIQYYNSAQNANTQDSAVAQLNDNSVLGASINGIGTPTGSYDPPQNGWCGSKSGIATGVTSGCITAYPSTIQIYEGSSPAYFKECFDMNTGSPSAQSGDSGSLWLDQNLRVHGMLGWVGGNDTWFMRWQNVANAWSVLIATQ